MNILFIGDIVGSPGREMVDTYISSLKSKYNIDIVIINGENAASGKGITDKIYKRFLEVGAHAVTMGNHTWAKREIFDFIDKAKFLVRPANFPEGTPGNGMIYIKTAGIEMAVINLQGRTFMPSIDCPFKKADELVSEATKRTPFIFVDFHAEATSEKLAMGFYLDGRVTAVVGTHTHVQTADNRIMPQKTAYITDVGMTGPYDGILGVERETIIDKFLTALPNRFEVAEGRKQLGAVVVRADRFGRAVSIERILINDDHVYIE